MITNPPGVDDETAGLEIDPRIHQRRVEVKRENTRRRLRAAAAGGATVALVLLSLISLHSPLAAVRHTLVLGAKQDSQSAVLAAAGISKGEPLIDISTSGAVRDIEALPWVERATVTKEWFTGVKVTVVERTAIAQLPAGSSTSGPVALVDATGRIVADRSSPVADLPLILGVGQRPAAGKWLAGAPGPRAADSPATVRSGIDQPANLLTAALALASTFDTVGLGRASGGVGSEHLYIGRVEISDGNLDAVVEPDLSTVQLGRDTNLDAKVNATLAMLTNADIASGSTIDVTTPESPTVTPPASASAG